MFLHFEGMRMRQFVVILFYITLGNRIVKVVPTPGFEDFTKIFPL